MGKEPEVTTKIACAHCGDPGEDRFCCTGCETVYRILHENGLDEFYRLDEDAGRSQRTNKADYDWLAVKTLADRFIRFRNSDRCHLELELPAIHCISCVWLLERLPTIAPGVRSCEVDVTRKRAAIVFDPRRIDLRQVAELLARIGYPPHFHAGKEEERGRMDRSLIYRIGFAGFAFGNTMLLSFPEYFGLGGDAGAAGFGGAVSYLLLLLSLPVLCYGGSGFFSRAYYGLRAGQLTIEVPIVTGMLALFGRSVYEILSATGPGYLDSLAGLVFFLLVGRWFQSYTYSRLNFDRDYRDYFPIAAHRIGEGGMIEAVASEELVVGDTILIKPGQLIPADGALTSATDGAIDYSFVTGEAEAEWVERGSVIFAGGRATDRALEICVSRPVANSYLLQLWRGRSSESQADSVGPSPALSRNFTFFVLGLAVATFGYWYRVDHGIAYRAATAVLIIACPCALALAAPFAYGTLQRLIGRWGYYLRGPGVLERMGKADAYVFDKTGTLVAENEAGKLKSSPKVTAADYEVLLAMCEQSVHPRSRTLALQLRKIGVVPATISGVEERAGRGLRLVTSGGEYKIGSAEHCGFSPASIGTYACIDGRELLVLTHTGTSLREGIISLLERLAREGKTYLLSGDHAPAGPFWEKYFVPNRTYFRQSPFDKQHFIEELEEAGARVLMVGDGLNDAGALRAASVGLAVSEDEARFSPACDGIVTAEQLDRLPAVLRTARRLRWLLYFSYGVAFAYNLIGLSYAVTGQLSPVIAAILMPLSSISVVVIAVAGSWWIYRNDKDHR